MEFQRQAQQICDNIKVLTGVPCALLDMQKKHFLRPPFVDHCSLSDEACSAEAVVPAASPPLSVRGGGGVRPCLAMCSPFDVSRTYTHQTGAARAENGRPQAVAATAALWTGSARAAV